MSHLYKLLKTIEEVIEFLDILTRESFEALDVDLKIVINQLKGILDRLSSIVEEGKTGTSPHLTYCKQRRNRLVSPQSNGISKGNSAVVQEDRQVVLVPVGRFRVHLQTRLEVVDCQVLESVVEILQEQVEVTDTDSDSDLPDLIDHEGNIVN